MLPADPSPYKAKQQALALKLCSSVFQSGCLITDAAVHAWLAAKCSEVLASWTASGGQDLAMAAISAAEALCATPATHRHLA